MGSFDGGDGEGVGGRQGSAHSVESATGVIGSEVSGVEVVVVGVHVDVGICVVVGDGVGGMQGSAHKEVVVEGLVAKIVGGEVVGVRVVVVGVIMNVGDGVGGM